ncbi:MAG TPA: metallophosphoesterase [Myxococcales bacterium]|nr:metallophosphoesterase [Myxococcales bacterium]
MRILLLADTHLGFDEPLHPRVERRRRGPDFFANFLRALEPARRGVVDVVVHGGDVFYRSKVPPALVARAFAVLAGLPVPVLVVPGNHERSRIPHPLLAVHRNVFLFDRPRTYVVGGVAFSGFPFDGQVRMRFASLVEQARGPPAAVRVLCLHQAVEGGRVGSPEFLFRDGPDVVRGRDLPAGFAAVLSGHLHRAQRLVRGLDGTPFAAPVFYPGSVERTSFAEREETKGFLIVTLGGGGVESCRFVPLPARPMVDLTVASVSELRSRLLALPPDAIVRVREGPPVSAAELRELAPPSMNVELVYERWASAAAARRSSLPFGPRGSEGTRTTDRGRR